MIAHRQIHFPLQRRLIVNKIDILQVAPYPDWDVDALERHFTLHRYFEAENKQTFLANCAASVRGIATRGDTGASRDMIEALPNLEIISVYGVGVDAIDIDLVRTRGFASPTHQMS